MIHIDFEVNRSKVKGDFSVFRQSLAVDEHMDAEVKLQTPHSGYVTLCYFNHCQHKNHVTMLYHVIDSKKLSNFSYYLLHKRCHSETSVIFTKKIT